MSTETNYDIEYLWWLIKSIDRWLKKKIWIGTTAIYPEFNLLNAVFAVKRFSTTLFTLYIFI